MTERGQSMVKHTVHISHQLKANPTKTFWTISCSQLCGNSLGMAP
ncbi:unnamed protein product, partial [Staurois parvus]